MFSRSPLADHSERLIDAVDRSQASINHGDLPRWQQVLDELEALTKKARLSSKGSSVCLSEDTVSINFATETPALEDADRETLQTNLKQLIPWRKGPYRINNCFIDTEWRSDWKWQRLQKHISPLQGKTVLDVGCGNGYHAWRMRGAGADTVVGIDPSALFVVQFNAIQCFANDPGVCVLPLRMEDFPKKLACFDTVFSMGVLYHRRDAAAHLDELFDALVPGGELVMETLILDKKNDDVIYPGTDSSPKGVKSGRYARMRNVWALPGTSVLQQWLENCGFVDVRLVSSCRTSLEEQRSTPWMPYESLSEALDPTDSGLTIEGWPAPTRAIMIARKKLK